MTSCGPYWQAQNYTHMFDVQDIRGPLPKKVLCPGSITDIIDKSPDLSSFNYILRLSGLANEYNSLQANYTVFVPSNKYITDNNFIKNMDINIARSIVRSCTVDNKITKALLQSTPNFLLITKNNPNNLNLQTISDVTQIYPNINFLQYDIEAINGMVHIVDKLIIPDVIL